MGHKIRTKWLNQILRCWRKLGSIPAVLLLPSLDLGANLCGHFRSTAVLRQQLWPSTEGIGACVINEHRPRKVPTAGPCVSSISQVNLVAWENCRQQDLGTVPGCRRPSSDTWSRAGRNCCSVLSWKDGHLNLQQLKWELSPIVQQWQLQNVKVPRFF